MEHAFPGDELVLRADDWNRVRDALPKTKTTVNPSPFLCEIYYARTGVGGIPARSGNTVGSATVEIYGIDGNTLTATGREVTVKNISGTSVEGSTYIVIGRENRTRSFVVIVESCEVAS
jgi:hypothetical protein